MKTEMNTVGPEAIKTAGPHLVSLVVKFGPRFHQGPLTNTQFIEKLRSEAKLHPSGFIKPMMEHFADHIEAGIKAGTVSGDAQAELNPNTTYYGHGSCSGCPGDTGDASNCCLCEYNGQNVGCEFC